MYEDVLLQRVLFYLLFSCPFHFNIVAVNFYNWIYTTFKWPSCCFGSLYSFRYKICMQKFERAWLSNQIILVKMFPLSEKGLKISCGSDIQEKISLWQKNMRPGGQWLIHFLATIVLSTKHIQQVFEWITSPSPFYSMAGYCSNSLPKTERND